MCELILDIMESVGYSEDTFDPSDFELTDYIVEGENKLAVRVWKWTSSSWCEDQDFYRFSGIFRDVFLYAVPCAHVEDLSVVPDKSFFRPELIVVDVPYSPLETKMRSMAKEVGCKTMNGLGMMLFQGAAAFKLWTGKDMPIEHMKEVLNIRYDD